MLINLLLTSDNSIKAKKNFQIIESNVNATPTAPIKELEPAVIVDYSEDYLKANYIYIDLYKRYYKILEKVSDIGKKIKFICTIDSVTSWINFLQNCDITVLRNGGIGAPTEIPDNKLPVKPSAENIKQVVVENDAFNSLLNVFPCVIQITGG